ncbi:hypothetical protein H6P81_020880 [Aristolochia fimbriata]|uniref:CST complex subunit CTC1 n=1 Tax=Aristolochia fimbriata TaxID=158543 RepID=A0AAV7DVP5_ARIFI|nr:hypothetical protein H6P81_020880 [Aristolochia fimbriata]
MEEPRIVYLAELLRRSRPLSGAASIRKSLGITDTSSSSHSISKKRKLFSSKGTQLSDIGSEVDGSEEIPASKTIYALRDPAVLVGTIRVSDSRSSSPGGCHYDCLSFSDGAAEVCCSVARLDVKILGRAIRIRAWTFIPLKCSGGVLEIIRWELVDSAGEVDFITSPLLTLGSSCQSGGEPSVCGKLVAVSPVMAVPSSVWSRKDRPLAEHGISDRGNFKGFLADVVACDCVSCNAGAFLEKSHHSYTKPGEMGGYKGIVTGIHMRGMVMELDKKVWLLLTDHLHALPHSLRIGSIVSLSNIHFVRTKFPWEKVLLLGACVKTNLHVNSFSPVEAQCIYRSLNQSSLGKFIESLTFSAKFWVLLVITCFRKKFAGTLSEKEILGSNHEEGFVQMYCRLCLPARAFRTQHQNFVEFCEHDCYNCGKETDTGNLKLVVPLNNFIANCQVVWINLLSQMQKETEITGIGTHDTSVDCVGKPHGRLTRKFISSKDLQVILMGTLQICPSGRLQMTDATGTIDVVVPDLLSNSHLDKIYEVKDYVLILEGTPILLDSIGSLENDVFSCRSIFNHVKLKEKKCECRFYVLFYLRNATCLTTALNLLHMDRHVSFNISEGSKFELLMSEDDQVNGLRSSFFAEAKILPYYLFLHGDSRDSLLTDVTMEELIGDLIDAQIEDDTNKLCSRRFKEFPASVITRRLTSCKNKLLQRHSTSEIPCSLAFRADSSEQLLACVICHDDSDQTSEKKVLLEFKHETFSQYKLLRIGALYIMQYEKEEVKHSVACRKAFVTSQKPIWSISFSYEKVLHLNGSQKSHSLEASSLINGRERFTNLHMNEVSSEMSTSDIRLYIPSEAADLLSGSNDSHEYGLSRPVVAVEQVLSVSACINIMATASRHVSVLCNPDCELPHGDLISLNGNIVEIHDVLQPSASCIHVCDDDDHMVMIQDTFGPNAYPVGMGPGMNATFYRVLMTGEHKLMLTAASFVVINSIKEVDINYFAQRCSEPVCDTENLSREFINMVPSCLIWNLYQGIETQTNQFCSRVVSVHSLVVEHTEKLQNTHPTDSSKMSAIRISLAGFILDDGSSSCSCWAYAEKATALLRLNETLSEVFDDSCCSLKWTSSSKTLKTIGNLLEKMLNKHGRVTVKKYGELLDSTSLDFLFSVDSCMELSSRDENLLKFIILNACCGPVLNVVGSEMDSDAIDQLEQNWNSFVVVGGVICCCTLGSYTVLRLKSGIIRVRNARAIERQKFKLSSCADERITLRQSPHEPQFLKEKEQMNQGGMLEGISTLRTSNWIMPAALLHERGCEGSVLLDATSSSKGEKNAFPNRNSARGFEVIDDIKARVEKACPSTVSCSDILTLASRDAVYLAGGPFWFVALGRRDGTTANENDANTQLPSPFESLQNIIAKFTSKGLTSKDVVVLSGAHTIGFAQCFTFKRRLFNFGGSGKPDPSLDSSLLGDLQSLCPDGSGSDTTLAPLDPVTKNRFDNSYYRNLMKSSGLLESDQALMGDNDTASMVSYYSKYPYLFNKDFGASMAKMASIGVLTGENGEIRKNCRVVN